MVSFGSLQVVLRKLFGVVCFRVEHFGKLLGKSFSIRINFYIFKTTFRLHHHVRYELELYVYLHFDEVVYLPVLDRYMKINLLKLHLSNLPLTECSESVPVNTMSGLLDLIDDPPIRYGFVVN